MKKIGSLLLFFLVGLAQAQQLNCRVQVNTDQLAMANIQIFKTLEKAATEFINNTDWTGEAYKQKEKINCSMVIIVSGYDSNQFTASLQVQSTRTVFNSTYDSPVFNFNDKDFNFNYVEFQNLVFNPNAFDSNLMSLLAFYSYMIIAFDADTFSPSGGSQYFATAQDVLTIAQQGGYKGWSQTDGNQNRFFLITDLLSGTFDAYRQTMYQYHREGLDTMSSDQNLSKKSIVASIKVISKLNSVRPNAFLTRVFFDAKSDEIISILSGGPKISLAETIDTLNRISPLNSSKWSTIKL